MNNTDDPSSISTASVWYKKQTESEFIEGHECTFGYLTPTQQLLCNIMLISNNIMYDIQIVFTSGPFNETILSSSTRTKNEDDIDINLLLTNIGNTYYVTPLQSNSTICSEIEPCSINTAISMVQSNDEIICLSGTYYSGDITLPMGVIIRCNDNDGEIIFDGSLEQHTFEWIYDSINKYWYNDDIILSSLYGVIANNQRLFRYDCMNISQCTLSLIDLGLSNFSGFYYDININRLYVKFGGAIISSNFDENINPNDLYFEIAAKGVGFYASDNTYFYGITFKNYGSGQYSKAIYIDGASNVVLSNNQFIHCSNAVGIKRDSNNVVVEYNTFIDSKFEFLWEAIKATGWMEGGGFVIYASSTCGRGVIVRYNIFDNFFDCLSGGGSTTSSGLPHEYDYYGNIFDRCSDDGLSLDGQCSNCRIWNNTISRTLSAISVAPLYYGPIFLFRNLIFYLGTARSNAGYGGYPFKTNSGDINSGKIYIYHNTVDNTYLSNQNGMQIKNGGSWELVKSRNNIYLGTNYGIIIQNIIYPIDMDYDCAFSVDRLQNQNFYWDSYWRSFEEFQSFQEQNGFFFNPIFNKHKLDNSICYDLSDNINNSILIDSAQIIPGINNFNYIGNGPDIGRYEYGEKDFRCMIYTDSPNKTPTNTPSKTPTNTPTKSPSPLPLMNDSKACSYQSLITLYLFIFFFFV